MLKAKIFRTAGVIFSAAVVLMLCDVLFFSDIRSNIHSAVRVILTLTASASGVAMLATHEKHFKKDNK